MKTDYTTCTFYCACQHAVFVVCIKAESNLVDVETVQWTPEGRRLVTGASSGEFTLWHGLTFSFETILQVFHTYEESFYLLVYVLLL